MDLVGGKGTNVAANVQAGAENNQSVGYTSRVAPTVSLRPHSRVDTVDQSSSTTNETPPILWAVLGALVAFAMYLLYRLPPPVKQ